MARSEVAAGSFGPNAWLVDDMYDRFLVDPSSVSESWREFFADYRAAPVPAPQVIAPTAPVAPVPPPVSAPTPRAEPTAGAEEEPVILRGAASRIVANMEASLGVPTATSVRTVPARLLEVNRQILNNQLARTTGAKVSFTHLIGFAIVRALCDVPALNAAFVVDAGGSGKPGVIHHKHVGLGLAVDQQKSDGSRTLLVPCIRDADTLDFRAFVVAYEDLIRKIHTGKISPDDFSGTTVSLTNPGTLGTAQSVPRLMPGQGAIIGVGALGYPAGYRGGRPRVLAQLGLGKVVTLTSTYDHRIIQGAESGIFLGRVAALLTGEDGFYDALFESMGVPYEPVRWHVDNNAGQGTDEGEYQRLIKQVHVQTLINMYRVRGHLIAHLDPLDAEPPHIHPELDPLTYGLTIWDLPRTFVTDGLAGRDVATLDEILHVLRDAYCRTLAIEYMHIQDPEQKRWIQQHVEGQPSTLNEDEQRHILDRLNAAEVFERFLHTRYVGQKRFGLEGAESTIVLLDTLLDAAAGSGVAEVVMGMSHRGRLNVLANIVGKSYKEIFEEFEGNLDPESVQGSGDVKYHKGARGIFKGSAGEELPVTLASNPSHLEAVDPVVEGMTRAKQDRLSPPTDGTPKALAEGTFTASPACRCWCTVTPRSPARAWWRRRSTCPGSRGTAPVARCTSSSTTSWDSPPRRHRPAPRSTRPTWPKWCRRRSSTSTATTPKPACGRPDWPSRSARRSTRTSSSTSCATASTGTTRGTTPATPSRSCTSASTPSARCASSTPRRWSAGATSRSKRPNRRWTTSTTSCRPSWTRCGASRRWRRPTSRRTTGADAEHSFPGTPACPVECCRRWPPWCAPCPKGSPSTPSSSGSSPSATTWWPRDRWTGLWPRHWPSAHCCTRASTSG